MRYCLWILLGCIQLSLEMTIQDDQTIQKTENDLNVRLLDLAPCPPPWDVSWLFSSSLCLDCSQRIHILNRCQSERNITLDCNALIECQDCLTCGLCTENSYGTTDVYETLTDTFDIGNGNDNFVVEVAVLVCVCVPATGGIIFVVVILYKRRRAMNSRLERACESDGNVENQKKLLPDDNKLHAQTGALLEKPD